MAIRKILVPYNFTVYEQKALDFVVSVFAGAKETKVTLFNTYTPVPEIDLSGSPEMGKMRTGLIHLSEEMKRRETGLKAALDFLRNNGFPEEQTDYILKKKEKDVAEEIMDAVSSGQYDVLVLSPTPGKAARLFARSVHERVLRSLRDVIVCVAT